ncbi:MAG: FAD-dependent oxidoreductase [Gammaproteobacteria bacterium]|jgi:sulfide:quinone oxidoreductase|nr:FAD-dependent oxidoreductase [Gammaproteobacteria bacterium]MBT4607943.1 FAD-dependent oxidoreductase [Thiotrichales bacterium]MBT3472277.1 FAD-dependent oxidoreductase [Gammaproteobacteria bacterium]MBT3966938.1 FAD-dependent oxidoreductase [Gammaproteobacteria bacterium]MBT4329066.1 FAD-dependent oxidoreductase [Gammaproteobacteria bacterium]
MESNGEQIVILGAGFAALTAIKSLRKNRFNGAITVISPHSVFAYLPSTIWIPSGLRSREDLEVPLENFFTRFNVRHFQGSVTGLNSEEKRVQTDNGEVPFDRLLIASGARFIQKLPGIKEHAIIPCDGIKAGEQIRDRLAAMDGGAIAMGFAGNPNEPAAMRGGPVFEFLYGIDTLLRKQGRRDKFKLTFFSPAPEPGKRMGPNAVKGLLKEMAKRNIDTHLGHKMKGITENSVITEGGEFASELTLFMPGLTGPAWLTESGLPLSAGGFVVADKGGRIENHPNIYVAGDSGSFPGPAWLPKQAHMADLQAEAAIKNMLSDMAGRPEQHQFKVELICIVDSISTGVLVYRDMKRAIAFKCRLFHWAKLLFERLYLRSIR